MTTGRRLAVVVAVTALHAAIAGLAASPLFFWTSVATARWVFGGSNGEANLFEDVRSYREYASRTLGGEVPYRDFVVEYPIGALPLFLAPRLVAAGPIAYRWLFAAEVMLFDAWIVWMIAGRSGEARRSLTAYTLGLWALGALPIARFDLAPTALALAAAIAWGWRSGTLAALGGLMKLFPFLAAVPALLGIVHRIGDVPSGLIGVRPSSERSDRRNRAPGGDRLVVASSLLLTAALGVATWMAIGGAGVGRSLRYHSGRGLEIESVYAGLLILAAKLSGSPLSHDFNHASVELIAPGAAGLAAAAPALQVGGVALVAWWTHRSKERDPIRFAGACILAFAVLGKVLSPQYLLWILPFAAMLGGGAGRWARPLAVAACALTTLLYFWAGVGLLAFHPLAVAILNARNAALIGLLATFVAGMPARSP